MKSVRPTEAMANKVRSKTLNKRLNNIANHPLRYTSILLRNEKDEDIRNVEKLMRHAYSGKILSGNAADKARIKHELIKPKEKQNAEFILAKKQDIRSRGSLKNQAKFTLINSMSQDENFGNMSDPMIRGITAYSYMDSAIGRLPYSPQKLKSKVLDKITLLTGRKLRNIQYKLTKAKLGLAGSFLKTEIGSGLRERVLRNKTILNTARIYSSVNSRIKKVSSKGIDIVTAPVRAAGSAIDFAKAKIIKPVILGVCGVLLFQLLIAALSGSGGSGAVSSVILDTKEHFNSFQNAFDAAEEDFQNQINKKKSGYAETRNEKGQRIKYGTKRSDGVVINYDSVTTNNIDDLLTVMTVYMDQAQEENHEEALLIFNEMYFASHTFSCKESPLYYCSGCVKKSELDEDGNRISWWECYGHVDLEISVHVQAIDELMLTYGFDEERIDWAYAIRNAGDFASLYNIKSMSESIAGYSGFYIDGIRVNASSKTIPDNGSSMGIVYFSQGSGMEWANVPFGGGNIASSGCSVTSLAMVLSYLKGRANRDKWIFPNEIVAAISSIYGSYNKFYVSPYGQDGRKLFPAMSKHYGINCEEISSESILKALKDNRPVIMSCVPGEFTKQGHFIVLTGLSDDGYIFVNDPNGSHADKSYKKYTLNEIKNNGKGWWMFWN